MRNLRPVLVVAEMTIDSRKTIVDRAPYRYLAVGSKQCVQIVLEIGQQKGADAGGFEQPHISRLPAGHVDVRVQRDARAPQYLIHLGTPDFALEAAVKR